MLSYTGVPRGVLAQLGKTGDGVHSASRTCRVAPSRALDLVGTSVDRHDVSRKCCPRIGLRRPSNTADDVERQGTPRCTMTVMYPSTLRQMTSAVLDMRLDMCLGFATLVTISSHQDPCSMIVSADALLSVSR